ncbi:MAG: hypothetical protein CVU05_08355 [Bacteroidetes bacterium HGW-Bacteroidetes-21]|jgi:hypothetical protein|nr:MAG: hypothetical protein CVU05_08355 [Bacteroidetes bacterium HGW-Bacteroidetes-21]
MDNENLRDKIKDFLQGLPGKYTILEERIPVEVQLTYFEFTRKIKEDLDKSTVMSEADKLFAPEYSISDKKELLARLASLPEVEAYRTIEKFSGTPDTGLEQWSKLALLESRMLLESFLTDEGQVLIASGLGGKNGLLRYFFVGFLKENIAITDAQKKVIDNEFEAGISQQSGVIENTEFSSFYFTLTCLLPVQSEIHELFKRMTRECNVYGSFLRDNFIVTNVKFLNDKEIQSFVTLMDKPDHIKPFEAHEE